MDESLEETMKFKRSFKRALIVFAVVEFIVTAFGVFYALKK